MSNLKVGDTVQMLQDAVGFSKGQVPVVQVGQTWVSLSNRQEVQVFRKPYPSEGGCGEVVKWVVGTVLDESINLVTTVVISELDLISHFKLKK